MSDKKLTSYPKEKINILLLENISDTAVQNFKKAGYASVKKIGGAVSEEELMKAVKDVHLLGIRSKTQITKNILDAKLSTLNLLTRLKVDSVEKPFINWHCHTNNCWV